MEFGSYEGMAALSQMIATAVREGLRLDREERRIEDGENFNAEGAPNGVGEPIVSARRNTSPSRRSHSPQRRSQSIRRRSRSRRGRSRSPRRNNSNSRGSSSIPSLSVDSSSVAHTSSHSRHRNHHHRRSRVDVVKDVRRMAYRPDFGGRGVKPEEVLSFVSIVEDLFTKRYSEIDKVKAAVLLLKDKARVWFDTLKKDREGRGLGPISTWADFKNLFLQNFLPSNFDSTMRQKLFGLKQTSMSVSEYKSKFDEHVVYFPSWSDKDRVDFFVENLKNSIKFKIIPYSPATYDEAHRLALNFERESSQRIESQSKIQSFKRLDGSNPQSRFSKTSKTSEGRKVPRLSEKEQEEHVKKGLCFNCHEPGHRSRECPNKKKHVAALEVEEAAHEEKQLDSGDDIRVSAAVMNLEIEKAPTVVQIKGFLNFSLSTMILIDSGSSHNMMSSSLARKLNLPLIPINSCSVLLPNGDSSTIDHRVLNVPISIQGVETTADFEVWSGARYDVILGMAWLREVDT